MLRAITLLAAVAACSTANAGAAEPAPHLAVATGSGTQRIAVWVRRTASGQICAASRSGASSAPPTSFTCLTKGLTPPPLLEFEAGGGLGAEATWGIISGLVAPSVTKLDALTLYGVRTSAPLTLHAIPSLPGWHAFSTGVVAHPTSTQVAAYNATGALVTQASGALIHGPAPSGGVATITPPGQPASGPAWTNSASNLSPLAGAGSTAVSIALDDPVVGPIISANHGWLETSGTWFACSGRILGRVLTFKFGAPASFTANLPSIGKPAGNFAYSETVREISAANWTGMLVWVDDTAAAVVSVIPDDDQPLGQPGAQATPLATVVPAHDAGGPDTPNCWQSGD
jgi:hypothetical protein